jgi:hypothetical protein
VLAAVPFWIGWFDGWIDDVCQVELWELVLCKTRRRVMRVCGAPARSCLWRRPDRPTGRTPR